MDLSLTRLRLNVLANYAGTFASIICPLIVLPFYLNILGAPTWGLIALMTTLQVFFSLLDTGVSQALLKEFSLSEKRAVNQRVETGYVLFGFERLYWCFCALLAGVVFLLSDFIAQHWLHLDQVSVNEASLAIKGAAVIFFFQFPGFIYRSLLLGTQNQVRLNAIVTVSVLVRQLGGILVILIWPSLLAFIIWHVLCVAIDTFVKAHQAWAVVGIGTKRSDFAWLTPLMQRYTAVMTKMTVAILMGAAVMQVDKLILTGMVSVAEFGYYTIASSLATGALQLISPIITAALPHATAFKDDALRLRLFNLKLLKLVLIMLTAGAAAYYFMGEWFLNVWLQDKLASTNVSHLLNYLLVGTALNCLYNIGYMNWIIRTDINKLLFVNITALLVSILTIPLLVDHYGLVGASIGWILMNLLGLLLSIGWLAPLKENDA